ncbi:MAG: hypothetical protein QOD42_2843 [Sphingomonadales bacterium]|jgi:hypothetical protein|nr:hypothetical protein [Sphingomonadales bacterium]
MGKTIAAEFGYYPQALDLTVGPVTIATLSGLDQTVADVNADDGVDGDWIYSGPQRTQNFGGQVYERPYPARVFGLPKTHRIEHAGAKSPDRVTFQVWALSFFLGTRLTIEEAGFLDATPIKPGRLVDFVLLRNGLPNGIQLAEDFWRQNSRKPVQFRRWAAAVHALFIAQCPQALQFEEFMYLYTALDACFAMMKPKKGYIRHAERIEWMCKEFAMPVPAWAATAGTGKATISAIRNPAIHEALFMGAPLGFALHGVGTNQNLTLEMQALVCRLLAAIIGAPDRSYITSPVTSRQRHGLTL